MLRQDCRRYLNSKRPGDTVLASGLRFCLPPKNVDRYDIKCSFELLYCERLKLEDPLTSENHFQISLPINCSFFSAFRLATFSLFSWYSTSSLVMNLLLQLTGTDGFLVCLSLSAVWISCVHSQTILACIQWTRC